MLLHMEGWAGKIKSYQVSSNEIIQNVTYVFLWVFMSFPTYRFHVSPWIQMSKSHLLNESLNKLIRAGSNERWIYDVLDPVTVTWLKYNKRMHSDTPNHTQLNDNKNLFLYFFQNNSHPNNINKQQLNIKFPLAFKDYSLRNKSYSTESTDAPSLTIIRPS